MKVVELFAGVGGFRVGLEQADPMLFDTVWSNQFEPATTTQHASIVYKARFGFVGHSNQDIAKVKTEHIPDHDMLVGGFPCQDYSVATSLNKSKGLEGKKGVLWWEIYRILKEKGDNRPSILFFENVDRLVLSPSKQRGRDFAIILSSLNELGYIVEWRIINAAEYGMPQRRRRTYILAYLADSTIGKTVKDPTDWIFTDGVFAQAFPVVDYNKALPLQGFRLSSKTTNTIVDVSEKFNKLNLIKPFYNAGLMVNGQVYTYETTPNYQGEYTTLGDIIAKGKDRCYITEDFYISPSDLERWRYCKGAKREYRKKSNGIEYIYTEGAMDFPDSLEKASRTIITSEGGKSPDRCRHAIYDNVAKRYRRLIPLELERLNMFPDHHTEHPSVNNAKRAFLMGNALVCGVIARTGKELATRLKEV